MERMIDCMDVENVTQAKKTERYRVEKKYVDRKALRECIINAFAHNDYSESNTPVFEVFDDRFEITTYGDLLAWIDKDSFFNGISRPRNPEIMRIFRDLEYVENLGSGIPYIIKLYGQDIFQFSKVATKVVLQKEILGMDFWDSISETTPKLHQKTTPKTISVSPKSKDKVLMYMRNYPQISTKRLAELMDMSVDGIKYISKRLQAMQQIRRVCPSRGGHWEVIENNTDN
jgi:predicted HTH transcriptional regulator